MKLAVNVILNADTYKNGHVEMIKDGVDGMYDVIVPRKGTADNNLIVPIGIQYTIKNYIDLVITYDDIDEAELEIEEQGGIFTTREIWEEIVRDHGGKLPIRIRALPEGTVVPVQSVVATVEGFGKFKFIAGYVETVIQRGIQYPSTVATEMMVLKKLLAETMMRHAGHKNVDYHVHNFGDRSAPAFESAIIAGMSHGVYFSGTDCLSANRYIKHTYNTKKAYLSSVMASEHSVTCSNSDAEKRDDFNFLVKFMRLWEKNVDIFNATAKGSPVGSLVIDTYNDKRMTRDYIGTRMRDTIIEIGKKGGVFVCRPDSGNSVTTPIEHIEILMDKFGYTVNAQGYKVLPSYMRVLQGDGINTESIKQIIDLLDAKKISLENIIFGMGNKLELPEGGRDRYSWSMKATAQHVEGEPEWEDLFKDPITDTGKRSHKGRVTTFKCKQSGKIFVDRIELMKVNHFIEDMLVTMYENGTTMNFSNYDEVRERANKDI